MLFNSDISPHFANQVRSEQWEYLVLPLDEAITSRAVFVIVSGSDGHTDVRADGNAVEAS